MAFIGVLGAAACSRADDHEGDAAKITSQPSQFSLDMARTDFMATPNAVPGIVHQLAAEFPKHPPLDRDTALLIAAARTGFNDKTFDAAVAAKPASGVTPDQSTRAALMNFVSAYKRLEATSAGGASPNKTSRLALILPTTVAAREKGLALDRINLLSESTRNDPEVVNAITSMTQGSDGSELMLYSRDNVGPEDEAWGGNQRAEVAAAVARGSAALRTLNPGEVATIKAWLEGPGGGAERASISTTLAQAYDAAGAAMTKDYFRRVQADRAARKP